MALCASWAWRSIALSRVRLEMLDLDAPRRRKNQMRLYWRRAAEINARYREAGVNTRFVVDRYLGLLGPHVNLPPLILGVSNLPPLILGVSGARSAS